MNFTDDREKRLKFIWNFIVIVIALFVLARNGAYTKQSSFFSDILIDIVSPLQSTVSQSYNKVRNFFHNYVFSVNASKENIILHKELEKYQKRLFTLSEIQKENERLRKLLGFVSQRDEKHLFAQVLAYDSSAHHRVIRINKGKKDGVSQYSPVVTSRGLVGYVFRVSAHYSDVLTILDPNNRVDGIISRIRTHGIVEGDANGRCLVKYISRTKPLILDDVVITSGLGSIYPKGIRVGRVSEISRDSYGSIQNVFLRPSVKFSEIEEVVVLENVNQFKLRSEKEGEDE